jgi:hypothetical protein
MENLRDEKQQKLSRTAKPDMSNIQKIKSILLGEDWEFENYIKERLKALGILQ